MFTGSGQVESSGSGTITALNGAVTFNVPTSSSAAFQITGTWSATLSFEATIDGTNWFTVQATTLPAGSAVTTTIANNAFLAGVGGYQGFRVRASLFSSGTVTINWNADNTPNISSTVYQGNPPWAVNDSAGDASLSSIDTKTPALGQALAAASTPVVLTAAQVTTLTPPTTITVTQATGTNLHTTVDNFPAVQAVSTYDVAPSNGTITALDTVTSSLTGANGQVFYFGTPTTNSAAVFALSSAETVSIQANILGGGGTLVVEVSADGGQFWLRPFVFQPSTSSYANAFTLPFVVSVPTAGMTHIRVRATVSWSGTATIIAKESINGRNVTITDPLPGITGTIVLPTGAATSALQTSGNTSLSSIDTKTPALGQALAAASVPVVLTVAQLTTLTPPTTVTTIPADGSKTTYSAAILSNALAALTTDFFTITGSATKTIRVTEILVTFTGGGVIVSIQLLKRSTANTGGTSTTVTGVPHDSVNAAATAAVRAYTVNPTSLGSLVGVIRADKTDSPLISSTTAPQAAVYSFGVRPSQAIVLRGTSEVLSFNLNGVTLAGAVVSAYVEWTEES